MHNHNHHTSTSFVDMLFELKNDNFFHFMFFCDSICISVPVFHMHIWATIVANSVNNKEIYSCIQGVATFWFSSTFEVKIRVLYF